ncbi:hypothetical protein PoB_000889700 [Plakobranchus ocellatus]|uniref:Uncharacterized protein n=1 Tax=Plakobranchus ocellatus TaxID=259542 RepID=A0AAV3YJ40_9GAST|nr:hypothetical protein PoB_000889700 [Plakobranchus ocellatus]
MGCIALQREYICEVVDKEQKKKNCSGRFHLKEKLHLHVQLTGGTQTSQSLKKMFLDTLHISERLVWIAINKKTSLGVCDTEKRGKYPNRGKLYERDEIKKHINSFPRVESHYARRDSTRKYLKSSISLQRMYNMYVDNHARAGCNSPASETTYRDVFNKEFNIGFFKCAKDRCHVCAAQENI